MKKIWLWILLLILLIIFCVWSKKDTIHINHTVQHSHLTKHTAMSPEHLVTPIEFDIREASQKYRLSGRFRDTMQEQMLQEAFAKAGHSLSLGNTSTNAELVGNEAIVLVATITPVFTAHYKEGRIGYHNRKLTVEGRADSYEAQRAMQALLSSAPLLTEDKSVVVLPREPIEFTIEKNNDNMRLRGYFSNHAQPDTLLRAGGKQIHADTIIEEAKKRVDPGAIALTEKILPCFSQKYTHGSIMFKNGVLYVEGMAKNQAALNEMATLLQNTPLEVVNHTQIDPRITEELARLEAEKKALQREAQLEAARKAKEAQLKKSALEKEAQKKAAEETRKLVMLQEAEAAKKNIQALLKVKNIEFDTGKASLTDQGKKTVDRLAKILSVYPHIHIEIEGHTDSDGDAVFNQKLSQNRVDTVRNRLIAHGIQSQRLKATGYGESRPLVPNTNAENKQKNRRVEIIIIGE